MVAAMAGWPRLLRAGRSTTLGGVSLGRPQTDRRRRSAAPRLNRPVRSSVVQPSSRPWTRCHSHHPRRMRTQAGRSPAQLLCNPAVILAAAIALLGAFLFVSMIGRLELV